MTPLEQSIYKVEPCTVMHESVGMVTIGPWKPDEALTLYRELEHPNWAPWLEAAPSSLSGRAEVFPHGQLIMKAPDGKLLASLSMNRITWDGIVGHLPNWDTVAGDPTDYSKTYMKEGNTLVLMSMNVAPAFHGLKLPSLMVDYAAGVAKAIGITHFIGSFRPSGYGAAKKGMGYGLAFDEYVSLRKGQSDAPLDPWLRSLWWKGMRMIAVDHQAMTVGVTLTEFGVYKATYKPELWKEIAANVWECEEVGTWTVDPHKNLAVYQEANVWGRLPLG